MPKKKDLIVIGVVLLLAVGMLYFASQRNLFGSKEQGGALLVEPSQTAVQAIDASPGVPSPTAAQTMPPLEEPEAFLVVTARGVQYDPIPLLYETEYTLNQKDTGASNTIHVTRDSIHMSAANCDNQDCVMQGTVTLDAYGLFFSSNMIVCLPNEVVLELLPKEAVMEVAP